MSFVNDAGEPVAMAPGAALLTDKTRDGVSIEDIAHLCHEMSRTWCAIIGEEAMPPWMECDDLAHQGTIEGVEYVINYPASSLAQQHDVWRARRAGEGWHYGEEKNIAKKVSPNMIEFDKLPWAQQVKDRLFRHIVHAIIG